MKEFIKSKKVTYNLMSFTGFKALLLFSLLKDGPKSYREIAESFEGHPYLKEKISPDTVRVYINSMKKIGCEITTKKYGNEYKYKLADSPYMLNVTEIQVRGLVKVYKILAKTMSVEELLAFHEFLNKLKENIKNPESLDFINKVSILKSVNPEILKQLMKFIKLKKQIVFSYKSSNSGVKDIEFLPEKFEIINDKIYVKGTGKNYDNKLSLLVSRINEIKEIKLSNDNDLICKEMVIGYEYFGDIEEFELNENEIIKEILLDRAIIEVTSDNEFFTRQRILALGDKARVVYPESYKNQFIKWLEDMEAGYKIDK